MKNFIKSVAFLLLVCMMFGFLQRTFGVGTQVYKQTEEMFRAYYKEEKNTVDAVFIGNSHVHNFWQPPFGYQEYGISVMNLSSSDMPVTIMKNIAIEACKTQNPKLLIFELGGFARQQVYITTKEKGFLVLNHMKYSANFFDAVKNHCDFLGLTGEERRNFYLPFLQFHSRWKELTKLDFQHNDNPYLNSAYLLDIFLTGTYEKAKHHVSVLREPIAQELEEELRKLLDWCKTLDVQVEFILTPSLGSWNKMKMYNYIGDIVKEYGFNFVNYNEGELYPLFHFDEEKDFFDESHTNINGSWKFSMVYAKRLVELYGLEDHRGEEKYQSWEKRSKAYYKKVKKYLNVN